MKSNSFILANIKLDVCHNKIKDSIYREKSSKNKISRSNHGGWHSQYKLHEMQSSIFPLLAEEILEVSYFLLKKHLVSDLITKLKMSQLWANINNINNWNSPHNHVSNNNRSEWSGVYYLDSESASPDKSQDIGGQLIFLFSEENGSVKQYIHTPKNGQIIIFRSDILHMVTPNKENKDRISIAFNLYEEL